MRKRYGVGGYSMIHRGGDAVQIEVLRTTRDADWPDADDDLIPLTREGNLAGFRAGDRIVCACTSCTPPGREAVPWWTVIGFGWTQEQLVGTPGIVRIDPTTLVLGTARRQSATPESSLALMGIPVPSSAVAEIPTALPQALHDLQCCEHPIPNDRRVLRFVSRCRFVTGDRVWASALRFCGRIRLDVHALLATEIRLGAHAAEVLEQSDDTVRIRIEPDPPYHGTSERTVHASELFPLVMPPTNDPWRAVP
jgi:hypothetical protein